jgi:hypothetical protein
MVQDPGTFLVGLAALALILERVVEKLFGWIPDVLRKSRAFKSSRKLRSNIGNILTIVILILGWLIAYTGNILVIEVLFEQDVAKLLDSFITALFIVAGADPIHQAIRLTEEKKEKTKEERRIMKIKLYRSRRREKAKGRGMGRGFSGRR